MNCEPAADRFRSSHTLKSKSVMSNQNKHYKQLTQGERYQIQVLLEKGFSVTEIGHTLCRHKSSISREIKRNSARARYCAEAAQRLKEHRKSTSYKHIKQSERHADIISKGLLLGWSPENISCRMEVELPEISLSHSTIYRRIAKNKAKGGDWYKLLPRYGKTRWKGGKRKAGRSLIPDRVDISERPEVVEQRQRIGDWEGDTVYGQDAYLVTLVERKSRLTLIGKVKDKTAETVANEMTALLKRVDKVHTITLDNGGEFAHHKDVAKAANADTYFARPYASYQRGTNENTNGLIRRSWPKKMKLGKLSNQDIRNMELLINTMPRKVLGGLTPLEVYTGKRVALIA